MLQVVDGFRNDVLEAACVYDGRDVVLGNLDCLIELPISVCIVYIHLKITNVASPCVQMSIFLLNKNTVIMILLRLTFGWLL